MSLCRPGTASRRAAASQRRRAGLGCLDWLGFSET